MIAKTLTTKQKINDILTSDYNQNGKYNLLCALSDKLERQKRYNEQDQVDAAIMRLKQK